MRRRTLAALVMLALPAIALAEPTPAAAPSVINPPVAPAPAAPAAPAPTPPAPPAPPVPSFEIRDRGESVEVIAHNVKAARTAVIPVRSRLEIPIIAGPAAKRVAPSDATVKLIELDSEDAIRVLSVKLGFERGDVKILSRFAQAIQVGDDLHVLVPRKVPSDGLAPKLPAPTLPPELAAAVARIDRAPAPTAELAHKPAAPTAPIEKPAAPVEKPAAQLLGPPIPADLAPAAPAAHHPAPAAAAIATATATAAPQPVAAPTTRPAGDPRALKQALASDGDESWSKVSMFGAIGLAAAGAGVWFMRRRRAHLPPDASIDVIAQRSLGGRARIVWLSAGPRELIVSVTGQQVRLLGQWRKTETTSTLPAAQTYADARLDARSIPEPIELPKQVSPAVSGILRLRARTGQMPVSEAVATGDVEADDLWAKEILAATGSRR